MSKKYRWSLLGFVLISGILSSCVNQKGNKSELVSDCDTTSEVIQTLENENGIFYLDLNSGKASIQIHTPGTIDEVSVYIICNKPVELPENNSKVSVSGKVRKSDQVAEMAGYSYYELEIQHLTSL